MQVEGDGDKVLSAEGYTCKRGLEYANTELVEKTENLGSVQSVREIAQEELGLVDPNTVILDPQS